MQCPACTKEIAPGDAFCSACGERLIPAPPQAEPIPVDVAENPIGSGERRNVTTLFADVVGSTALGEKIGEEALYHFMQSVIVEMTTAVREHGGTIEKLTGDGLMALFGAPLAAEEAPLNARRAGLDMLDRVAALEESPNAASLERPHIRIGVNTGLAVVGTLGAGIQQDMTALGDSVNVAARLEGLAEPDSMVVGEATHTLVADYVEADFAGEHMVKGKSESQRLWRVLRLKPDVRRFDASLRRGLTKLVGRRGELEELLGVAEDVRKGATRVVDIIGEAGLGKSRLVHEFRERLPADDVMWLQGNCVSRGRNVPFLPFIEVVRTSFGIAEDDDRPATERRLGRGLEVLGLDPSDELPYLLNLLGHAVEGDAFTRGNAEVAGIRTRDLLQRLVAERCRISPVVLHIDDLHWLDEASETLLARMVEDADDLPLLLLFTYRPEYAAPWAEASPVRTFNLAPLSSSATEELLRHRLDVDDLPAALARMVVGKAEGNPLFAEEIVNYLTESGRLENVADGDGEAAEIGLPASLENLLMARIEGLEEEPRALLQAAAVVGRLFSAEVAGDVAGLNGRMAASLSTLERFELVRPDETPGDYLFKNALIQDAVYNSLLSERRRTLHERAGEAIERRNPDRLGEIAETLAHHYANTPRAEKTVRYMAQAGEKSLRVYALDDAELRLRQVVELIKQSPGSADDAFLADVLLNLARVQYYQADMFGMIELLSPHLPTIEALDDPKRLARFLFEIGYAHIFSTNTAVGIPMLERARAIGEAAGDELITGYVSMGLLWGHVSWHEMDGEWRATIAGLAEEAERIGRKHDDNCLISKTLAALTIGYVVNGRPHLARRYAVQLFDLSRETSDPRPRAMGLWALATIELTHFAYEDCVESGRESARLALSVVDRSLAEAMLGAGYVMLGRTGDGTALLSNSIDLYLSKGLRSAVATLRPFLGIAKVMDGDMAGGIRWIEDGLEQCRDWGAASGIAIGHLVLGEIYTQIALGHDRPPLRVMLKNIGFLVRTLPRVQTIARRNLETALDTFRKWDTPSYIASALYNLARLDLNTGRADDAASKLAEARALAVDVEAETLLAMIDEAASG